MTSDEYAQILDDFKLNAPGDVMPGESLTEYIERRRREFESKADGGSIGIEVLFTDKKANGGRVGMLSGGLLSKGIMGALEQIKNMDEGNLFSKLDPLGKAKTIKDALIDRIEGFKEIIKDLKTQGRPVDEIEDIKFEMDEAKDGLEKINKYIKNQPTNRTLQADGGRVGLFMGGDPLTGQALQIYNSMKGYNFSDQEIADALSARGLYTPGGTTTTPSPDQGIIGIDIQDRGGGRETTGFGDFGNLDPNTEKTFTKDVFTIDKNMYPGAPMTGSFQPTEITGYKNINTGNYQTLEGKNINHGGIPVKPIAAGILEAIGLGVVDETDLTGLSYPEGYIAGTFTGKNPIDLFTNQQKFFKTQKETIADINAKLAEEQRQKELQAKIQAEINAGKSLSQIGRENFTGKGQAFERRSDTFSGGKVKDTGGVPGGKYGSPRKDGGLMFARGGLATMFTRRR